MYLTLADRPTRPEARPSGSEVEVTPEMIAAGVDAYYENAIWGWDNPGNRQLREMVSDIFVAMCRVRRS